MEMDTFFCEKCKENHEEWPALYMEAPQFYYDLEDDGVNMQQVAHLDDDFCRITWEGSNSSFIRCSLILKVKNGCQPLEYSVWVLLTDEDYDEHGDFFDKTDFLKQYAGVLANDLEGYGDTLDIPLIVRTGSDEKRPEIFPIEEFIHPFVTDYYEGITEEKALSLLEDADEDYEFE
jgi:hypothetical protein